MKLLAAIGVLLAAGLAFYLLRGASPSSVPDDDDWRLYAKQFVTPEGRVIDVDNRNVSHSESQGFGLVLAEAHGDREAFDRMLTWTDANLRREDGLYAWRYLAEDGVSDPVPDKNNASDGDILICWALLRASERWDEDGYRQQALSLADVIKTKLIVERDGQTLLKPGLDGFFDNTKTVVNPSYWVFPALAEIAAATTDEAWRKLSTDGAALIVRTGQGRWGLPPDWLDLHTSSKPAADFPPRFSFDAVRVPLYLAWAGLGDAAAYKPYADFWGGKDAPAAWVDLTDGSEAEYAISPGVMAIRALALARAANKPITGLDLGALKEGQGYYSSSLFMLAKLAVRDAAASS
jgi:endoglucanase